MVARELDGTTLTSPEAFYEQFFRVTEGLIPDYGGRNLDALNDDLRDLAEPLELTITNSAEAVAHLGDWFEVCLEVLRERDSSDNPVTVHLS